MDQTGNNVNNYVIMDCSTSIDLRSGKPVPSARIRTGGSYTEPEWGHTNKTIFELDNISMLLAGQEPGVDSPYFDYVYHPDHEEVEFVLSGKGKMCYADGTTYDVKEGHCMYHGAGYPHRLHNAADEQLNLLVMLSGKLSDVTRCCSPEEDRIEKEGGHKLVFCPDQPALSEHGLACSAADGYHVSLIYDGDNICFAYVVMNPGCCVPVCDFISHPVHNELIYVYSGKGTAIYPDKAYTLRPGLAAYNPPGQPVKYWNNTDGDLVLLIFYSTGKLSDVKSICRKAIRFEDVE